MAKRKKQESQRSEVVRTQRGRQGVPTLCARCSKKKGEIVDGERIKEDIEVKMISLGSTRIHTKYRCPKCRNTFKKSRPVEEVLMVSPDETDDGNNIAKSR